MDDQIIIEPDFQKIFGGVELVVNGSLFETFIYNQMGKRETEKLTYNQLFEKQQTLRIKDGIIRYVYLMLKNSNSKILFFYADPKFNYNEHHYEFLYKCNEFSKTCIRLDVNDIQENIFNH